MQNGIRVAISGSIVVLGIRPDKLETGFGYIKSQGNGGLHGEFDVAQFIEKPDLKTAEAYLACDDYTWNGGTFIVLASVWLNCLKKFRKDILDTTTRAFEKRTLDQQFIRPDRVLFESVPSDSVDYAVMEKCPGSDFTIKMIQLDAGWNDLGSWDALWQTGTQDPNGNVFHGDVILEGVTNSYVHASHRLVSAVGVSNLVIIETADAILVADKNQSQQIKNIVTKLKSTNRDERILHRKVSRPWGWYDTIDVGERFKVKRIQVNPGASLSLQKHAKRAEHWVVVKGFAEVTCGKKIILLNPNESTFIPQGETHRLTNIGTESLEIIEVQSGLYLGEDDIVRFDDDYGRNQGIH
jgi:mannose-1-phosphate guanylyltransferase/mannose-6-phosphate isomerase